MDYFLPTALRSAVAGLALLSAISVHAATPEAPVMSASELVSRLNARQQGSAMVRAQMNTGQSILQLQIKSRAARGSGDIAYQVLWPRERKGEAVLLHRSGNKLAGGSLVSSTGESRPIPAGQLGEPILGTALSYEDVIDNYCAWSQQAVTGTETIDRANCAILESKPGKGDRSSYTSVRTWVDLKRLVPMRIEKYSGSGNLVRRIETTRVSNDDKGRPVPARLTVHGPGNVVTEVDGSRIKTDVSYTDADFTPEGLQIQDSKSRKDGAE